MSQKYRKQYSQKSDYPQYFTIETCDNCNAKCVMCPRGQKGIEELRIMSDELFNKILQELAPHATDIKMICMNSDNEPIIDPCLGDRIGKLKKIGIKHIYLATNASLMTVEKSRQLLANGLDDIRISLDAFSKSTYEVVRRGLDYNTVIRNIENLIALRDSEFPQTEIRLRMVELPQNLHERGEWLAYWHGKLLGEKDKVQLMPMHSWSGIMEEEPVEDIEFYASIPCVSPFTSMCINYDGRVQLCDSDVEQQVIMGDINKQNITEVWQSEKFIKIRELHCRGRRNVIPICRGCDHWSRQFKEDI